MPYLIPLVDRTRRYDTRSIFHALPGNHRLLIGAGAAPHWELAGGVNGELMANISQENNKSLVSRVSVPSGACIMEAAPSSRHALLGNFLS